MKGYNVLSKRRLIGLSAALLGTALTIGACGNKANESSQDSGVAGRDTNGATILNMPDGFSNVATKCYDGDRVFVLFHNDNAYGSVAVIGNDPSCKGK